MQKNDWILDLFRHMQCADAIVWQSVFKLEKHDTEPRLGELLYHNHSVQHIFLTAWENRPLTIPEPSHFPDFNSLSQWGSEYYKNLFEYLGKVDEAALEQPLNVPWTDVVEKHLGQPPQPTTLGETMLQVITHSAYHRGQINALLRKLNTVPPLVDYIAWIWIGRPEIAWPEAVSM
jgi:uncharacterized damage-inducible protein DinB